nr:MAG TPA: hypothetical protein [Caudoviricetes sp.]
MAYTFRPGEGCAGRFATGRENARSLRSLANLPGLRVPATPSVREDVCAGPGSVQGAAGGARRPRRRQGR